MKQARGAALRERLALTPAHAGWLLFLALAFFLRVTGLGAADLGLDEAISHYIIDRPALEIIRYCFVNVYEHPPTYYLLLRGWMQVAGASEFSLRFLSAGLGLISTAAVGLLARRWFGRRVASFAILLAAVWPMAVERGREARMYTLLPLAALLIVFAFDRALARNRWRDWGLFLVLFLFTLSIHYLAAFGIVGFAVLYVLWWRRRPELRLKWGVVLAILIGAPLVLIAAAPGPRASLLAFLQLALNHPWSPARLMPLYTGWVLGTLVDYAPAWLAVGVSTVVWLIFGFGLARNRAADALSRSRRLIVLVLVLAPAVVGSMLIFYVSSRHHSALSNLFVIGVALGLARLRERTPAVAYVVTAALVAAALAVGLVRPMELGQAFSAPLAHIEARALDGEPVIYSYYFDRYQRDYYSQRDLPPTYVGNMNFPTIPEEADAQVAAIMGDNASAWLNLRPDEYNPEVVEKALDRHAFPGQKVWFAGGRRVNHYFAPVALTERPAEATWAAGIRLLRWWSSGDAVAAGDALRLQFDWQRTQKIATSGLVTLRLADAQGKTWAQRTGGPCNDQCPTDEWIDAATLDRLALEIAPDIPPGVYELRLGWTDAQGAAWPGRATADAVEAIELTLGSVQVTATPAAARPAAPLEQVLDAAFGDALVLRSAAWRGEPALAGATVDVALQWQTRAPLPALDVHLLLRRGGQETRVTQALGPAWYASADWPAGAVLRTLPSFTLPAAASAGEYEVAIGVSPAGEPDLLGRVRLGRLRIQDRPRTYTVPALGVPVSAAWAEGVALVRADAPPRVAPGANFDATLVWQAAGPAGRNWKVFFHLVDATGAVRAQGDGFPAGGTAPATGWRAGEVIVDPHTFALPADIPAGTYRLHAGFYDESTNERLPLTTGGDTFVLPVTVEVAP